MRMMDDADMGPVEDLDRYLTPEQLAAVKVQAAVLNKVSRAYDDALKHMTGRRQAGLEVDFAYLTAEFTEAQWTDYKRLVKQLCAERGLPDTVDDEVDSWRADQEEQRRELLDLEIQAEALGRMTGKRPSLTDAALRQLTAGFTEAQWTEMERLVMQIYAERGIDDPLPFVRPDAC